MAHLVYTFIIQGKPERLLGKHEKLSGVGEGRVPPALVLQNQGVQDVSAADAPPAVEAEMPAVIEHIVELVTDHQPTTPHATHGRLLSDWPWPIVKFTDRHTQSGCQTGNPAFLTMGQAKPLDLMSITKNAACRM